MTGPIERIAELLEADEPRLDQLMAVIASVDDSPPSEASVVEHLDRLADGMATNSDAGNLLAQIFGTLGFRGNTEHYYDARNSLIHHVLERRIGIPLTLAVVAIELARRCDRTLRAIGMPGHVLLGAVNPSGTEQDEVWFDPFAGGRTLTRSGCEEIFLAINPGAPFHDSYLSAMPASMIIGRTLENLRGACLQNGNRSQLAAVLRLRAGMPGAPLEFRIEYSEVLAAIGRHDAAAQERDLLASLQPEAAERHQLEARRLRTHRN